ncbi:MAG: cysteine desulfurase family protein [Anaerolineaceae bacterium]
MNLTKPVYFDYAATTPVDERVLAAMMPYFREDFGNPSSIHRYGQAAEAAVDDARRNLAQCLNCRPDEIIFTANGTESDNLALRGAAMSARLKRGANHILISPVEHHAVSVTARQLADAYGFEVEMLPVDPFGRVDPEKLASRLREDTAVVSVIYANNEIGTVNPIAELAAVCREKQVPFHTDAVQAAGYLSLNTERLPVNLMSIGAHKFYGPKGVGALFVRHGTTLLPTQTGGKQENGLRAGTQNVPYLVGMAEALCLAQSEQSTRTEKVRILRDRLVGRVLEEIPGTFLTGHPEQRLPNHASFVFDGVDGNTLLMMLDGAGFACSSGSACKTGSPEPSDVLLALGLSAQLALGSLRVTLGKDSTPDEVERFADVLPDLVAKVRILAGNRNG